MDIIDRLFDEDTPLFLAPQAGVSESPFRRLCRSFGADVVVSEFISAEGIVRNSERSHRYLRFDKDEHPIGVQIFGSSPETMARAARYVCDTYGPDFVDINFGCPVKKVVKRNGGSGCLRDLVLVHDIIVAVREAIPIPTTVKIRSGFDERTRDPVAIGEVVESAGARFITLHPRTRADMYSGHARWDEIAALKSSLGIPVVGNGDIRSGDDAARMRDETGCDGIMIARGSHGNPWIFRDARAALDGTPIPDAPTVQERFDVCLAHLRNTIQYEEDSRRALLEFRKHLGWYTKGLFNSRDLRIKLFQVETLEEVEVLLESYKQGAAEPVAEGAAA